MNRHVKFLLRSCSAVMRKKRHVTLKGIETDQRFTFDLTSQTANSKPFLQRIGGLNGSVFFELAIFEIFCFIPLKLSQSL